jgi:hypothetical protein
MGEQHRMFDNDYGQDEQESSGMKQLRQALDKANAALKAREDELGKLQGQVRTQSVREILRDLGVKPKVAGLIPSDIDSTPEAVEKWVKDYEDVFGSALRVEEKPKDSESEAAPVRAGPIFSRRRYSAGARSSSVGRGCRWCRASRY